MQKIDNFCKNCSIEKESGHRCYKKINDEYFMNIVLDEFFVKCGLCPVSIGLRGLSGSGWMRLLNSSRIAPHQGYICPDCALQLSL